MVERGLVYEARLGLVGNGDDEGQRRRVVRLLRRLLLLLVVVFIWGQHGAPAAACPGEGAQPPGFHYVVGGPVRLVLVRSLCCGGEGRTLRPGGYE